MNPVVAREARERARGRRGIVLLTVWVLGVGLITYAVYLIAAEVARSQFGVGRLVATGFMGKFLFQSMTLLLVTSVIMLVPGLTALAIIGERERQTLHLLQVTQLGPFRLVTGKLAASIAYTVLLLVAVAPIVALPLLFGGAGLGDVAGAFGMLVATAVMLAAVSIWVSSRARSSRGAVAGAYAAVFVIAFFTIALMVGELFLFRPAQGGWFAPGGREVYSVIPNPYFGMVSAVDAPLEIRQDISFGFTPYAPFEALLYRRQGVRLSLQGWVEGVAPGAVRTVDGRQLVRMRRPPLWIYTVGSYALVSGLALWRASANVRAPAGRPARAKKVKHAAA